MEERTLFGKQVARVMMDGGSSVHTVPLDILQPEHAFDLSPALSTVAGARIWSALGSDLFLAPLVSQALPLPHQFRVLRKAMSGFPIRMMLADEVGMGKTIEAGLLLKELKLRGMIERILVLAPKSLLLQWIVEMDTLFGESFDLVLPGDWSADVGLRGENAWKRYSQVVTSVDSVKPKEGQRGWTQDKIARYNVERFHDLIGAGWDLVIIDESHKVAGASDDVSRYELAKELARAVPHLLLLTATPHSGKSDAFRRLLTLLDPGIFTTGVPLTRQLVETVVIRTEKRSATDVDGKPLFSPRSTRLLKVPFAPRHALQQQLYEEVSQYVIAGYNRAERMGDKGSRLLLILIQRLMSSSTRAVRHFLEQRLAALGGGEATTPPSGNDHLPDDTELDDTVQGVLFTLPTNSQERTDVERLLGLAVRVESAGPDARAEALYEQMMQIALEENDPSTKFLVFTEFRATQEMLEQFLKQRGYPVATLNGTMEIAERKGALESFRHEAQTLISTDAGGEGLNMQFAHVVFNYDLPWNPMRVEQRIGRVDRIGQTRAVQATNLVLENSVEARLYEIWQEKLATILTEFGVDKTGDVLDSSEASVEFERLARTALLKPEELSNELDRVVMDIRKAAAEAAHTHSLYTGKVEETDHLPTVPLRIWMDTLMGAEPERSPTEQDSLDLSERVIERINALTPFFAEGKPVAHLSVDGLGFPLDGWFSLWKVGIADGIWRQQNVFALFSTDEGKSFGKSAQRLWDELAIRRVAIQVVGETMDYDFLALQSLAEAESAALYDAVVHKTRVRAKHRLSALDMSYLARRTSLARIELETVREARRRDLETEYQKRKAEINLVTQALPDMTCLFLTRVMAQ
ncbi:helicase-related protein [Armatimonas sp.]|uniref:DEAD/DEAH box helicase n=1 Tax=Armatimonas sp. TaxID=1872638 RepID=UPI00286ABA45|nr:helicase-related protein [Armatimonas sp.]